MLLRRPMFLRRLATDDRGAVLVLVTLTLPVILGFAAIVIDLGRLAAQQTELQSFADHVALAAAGELDGEPGAIARAQLAATAVITTDVQTFAQGTRALAADADIAFRFLSSLPANDDLPITAAFVTAADADARFVEATVGPRNVTFWLTRAASALVGGALPNDSDVAATAVAGFTEFVCDVTPLMFCAPNDPALYGSLPGRMIGLKTGGAWGPGAFGLLDHAAATDGPCGTPNQGANFWRCATALTQGATQCVDRRAGVDIRPGNVAGPTESGLNVRFDIYSTSLNSQRNNPNFAPGPNVVKGIRPQGGGSCIGNNFRFTNNTVALPRDSCFATNSCPGGRFGTGVWDEAGYIATNHNGTPPAGYVPGTGNTRYDLYLAELAAAGAGDILPSGKAETGRPQCSNQMVSNPERRVLVAAAIDCSTLPPGNASGVPTLDYWRIFITEPAGISGNGDVWVEVIDRVGPMDGGAGEGILRDVVQLYR